MVTAMRIAWGKERTRQWLDAMLANEPVAFDGNAPIAAAVGAGEIDAGLINHYYIYRFLQEEGESFPARNYFMAGGGPESLVMVAGAGILSTSKRQETASRFINFMLSQVAQQYFATQTYEYPLIEGVVLPRDLPPLESLNAMPVNLADLSDLQGSLDLLRAAGALP
jgi:iron(III) transport system substrate-binding protein